MLREGRGQGSRFAPRHASFRTSEHSPSALNTLIRQLFFLPLFGLLPPFFFGISAGNKSPFPGLLEKLGCARNLVSKDSIHMQATNTSPRLQSGNFQGDPNLRYANVTNSHNSEEQVSRRTKTRSKTHTSTHLTQHSHRNKKKRPSTMGTPFIALHEPGKGRNAWTYIRGKPHSAQDPCVPKTFLHAMQVREKVYVEEQKVPLENEYDDDDPRSWYVPNSQCLLSFFPTAYSPLVYLFPLDKIISTRETATG